MAINQRPVQLVQLSNIGYKTTHWSTDGSAVRCSDSLFLRYFLGSIQETPVSLCKPKEMYVKACAKERGLNQTANP